MSAPASDIPSELVEWFSSGIDEGDAPELHVVGLKPGDLVRCFDELQRHAPRWSDRVFYLDAEDRDVTVAERPDVAELVARGESSYACIGAEGLTANGIELPLVEMFLYRDEIHFFWWPGSAWTPEHVAAFFALLARLLMLADEAALRPDPRYIAAYRRPLASQIARVIGDPHRVDLSGGAS